MTDLGKLIEQVAAGTATQDDFVGIFGERKLNAYSAWLAYNITPNREGSVDAALALKAELLGERWKSENIQEFHGPVWAVELATLGGVACAENKSLARALLLAILKAYKWEQE